MTSSTPDQRLHHTALSRHEVIPLELRTRAQWLCWRREQVKGRIAKVPYRADGAGRASATDAATWCDYRTARDAARCPHFDGVGFVLTENDPFVGVDLDDCRDPRAGLVHPLAMEIIRRCATYTELSPSLKGIRMFGVARLPRNHPCRTGKIEVYSTGRYLTVTGVSVTAAPRLADISDALHWLFRSFFRQPRLFPNRCHEESACDDVVIERALAARNGAQFAMLWAGDWRTAGYASQSEADLALMSHLVYWCRAELNQMLRLFEQSGLCRPKWLERSDYRNRTVRRALAGRRHA